MKKLTAIMTCAAALMLLPSCVVWSIGENIRESAQWRFGVDTTHRYRCEGDKTQTTIAPECRFHFSHRVVDLAFPDGIWAWPRDYEYTGRYRVLTRTKDVDGDWRLEVGDVYDVAGRTLHRQPRSKSDSCYRTPNISIAPADKSLANGVDAQGAFVDDHHIIGGRKTRGGDRGLDFKEDGEYKPTIEKSPYYWLAATAAAPFDYAIDPALTIISAPFGPIYILLFLM